MKYELSLKEIGKILGVCEFQARVYMDRFDIERITKLINHKRKAFWVLNHEKIKEIKDFITKMTIKRVEKKIQRIERRKKRNRVAV